MAISLAHNYKPCLLYLSVKDTLLASILMFVLLRSPLALLGIICHINSTSMQKLWVPTGFCGEINPKDGYFYTHTTDLKLHWSVTKNIYMFIIHSCVHTKGAMQVLCNAFHLEIWHPREGNNIEPYTSYSVPAMLYFYFSIPDWYSDRNDSWQAVAAITRAVVTYEANTGQQLMFWPSTETWATFTGMGGGHSSVT